MTGHQPTQTPIVEPAPGGDPPTLTERALQQRIRQQEILAELGVLALQGTGFGQLLQETSRLTAEGLNAEFCKVLEFIPDDNLFRVRAGVGWDAGIVGVATVGADLASPAGFALRTGKPTISNHLENEERFRTPELLQRHGIHRAMNVILQGDGRPFGVLEVDSRAENEFVETDVTFLQGAANILGMAIERERHERALKAAIERHQFLLKEMDHRVKNSLSIVSSMLYLQARAVADPVLTEHLNEASNRIAAVARAHDRLYRGSFGEHLDVGEYIESICKDLDDSVAHCEVHTEAIRGIRVVADRAIAVALIVNELITNAAKYAYRGHVKGVIRIKLQQVNDHFVLSVRDDGVGLPPDFEPKHATGFGMRIIMSFVGQLQARLGFNRLEPGTEFVLTVPLRPLS